MNFPAVPPGWAAAASALVIAVIGHWVTRSGYRITQGTSREQISANRQTALEAALEKCTEDRYKLQQQILQEREARLEKDTAALEEKRKSFELPLPVPPDANSIRFHIPAKMTDEEIIYEEGKT